MKKINLIPLYILIISIAAFAASSCKTHSNIVKKETVDYSKEGYVHATVIKYVVDGCQYLLQFDSGKKLEVQNLPKELMKDKLEVWIIYQNAKGAVSICMAGDIVKLTDYKIVK